MLYRTIQRVGVGVTVYILIRCAVRFFFFFNFVPGQNYLVNHFYDFVCFLCVGFSAIFKNEIKIFQKKPFDKPEVDYIKLEDIKLV